MKKLIALITAVMMLMTVWTVTAAAETRTGRVFGGWLILRSTPSYSGAIKSSYPSGTVVQITGQSGAWYQVIAPDGLTGYMLGTYLKVSGGTVPTYTTAYVTSANGLNVRLRSGPGTGYSVLASYAPGTECTILEAGTNWCKIRIGTLTGYMMTKYLTGTQPSPQPEPQPETKAWVTSRNGKGVNLRSGPGKGYASIGFYSVGTSAYILATAGAWSYIRIGTRHGYMMSEFLTTTEPSPIPPIVGGAYITSANGKGVNMRTGPGTQYTVIRVFPVGTPVTIVARGDLWHFVKAGDYFGYIMKTYIYEAIPPNSGSTGGTASGSADGSGSGTINVNVTVNTPAGTGTETASGGSSGSSASGAASGSSSGTSGGGSSSGSSSSTSTAAADSTSSTSGSGSDTGSGSSSSAASADSSTSTTDSGSGTGSGGSSSAASADSSSSASSSGSETGSGSDPSSSGAESSADSSASTSDSGSGTGGSGSGTAASAESSSSAGASGGNSDAQSSAESSSTGGSSSGTSASGEGTDGASTGGDASGGDGGTGS